MTEANPTQALDEHSVYQAIDQFEAAYDYDASYMKDLFQRSPEAFALFGALRPMTSYYKELPPEAHYVAAIAVMQNEDCGSCLELNLKLAREAGVDENILKAVSSAPDSLPAELKDVYNHTLSCLGTGTCDESQAARIEEHFGKAAFGELALCIVGTRMYPGLKRALLKMQSCSISSRHAAS